MKSTMIARDVWPVLWALAALVASVIALGWRAAYLDARDARRVPPANEGAALTELNRDRIARENVSRIERARNYRTSRRRSWGK